MLRPGAVLVPEPVGKRLIRPGRLAVLERHEHDAIARLRQRRPIPRAVKCDERPSPVGRGELRSGVEEQPVGRPMGRKDGRRLLLLRARPDLLAVTAVLGSEHEPMFTNSVLPSVESARFLAPCPPAGRSCTTTCGSPAAVSWPAGRA